MELVLIKEGSPEWEYMWEWLAAHPINENIDEPSVALNPLNEEKWQYIGSYRQDMKIIHELRHKSHPMDNDRHLLKVNASENISGEDIDNVITLPKP